MVSITDEYMGISQLFLAMFPCCLLPKSVPVHRAFVAVDEKILQAITHFLFNRERRISVVFSISITSSLYGISFCCHGFNEDIFKNN